jgi:hypothetical protein
MFLAKELHLSRVVLEIDYMRVVTKMSSIEKL